MRRTNRESTMCYAYRAPIHYYRYVHAISRRRRGRRHRQYVYGLLINNNNHIKITKS